MPGTMAATILLVDDEPAIRQLIARALRSEGYHVLEARNGAEAASMFDEHGTAVDLLITDVVMPFLSGTDLVEWVRARHSTLAVLYITGFPDDRSAGEHRLVKPFVRNALLAAVEKTLRADGAPGS